MTQPAVRSKASTAPMVHRGTIVSFGEDGLPLVRAFTLEAPVRCEVLDTGMGKPEYQLGDTVAVATYAGDLGTGCILGRVLSPEAADAPVRRRSLRLEVEHFEVTARDRATVQTGAARVRLTRQGDLELVAKTLISRARRLQKLLAPILRLN
jgi:hypothetical protein